MNQIIPVLIKFALGKALQDLFTQPFAVEEVVGKGIVEAVVGKGIVEVVGKGTVEAAVEVAAEVVDIGIWFIWLNFLPSDILR